MVNHGCQANVVPNYEISKDVNRGKTHPETQASLAMGGAWDVWKDGSGTEVLTSLLHDCSSSHSRSQAFLAMVDCNLTLWSQNFSTPLAAVAGNFVTVMEKSTFKVLFSLLRWRWVGCGYINTHRSLWHLSLAPVTEHSTYSPQIRSERHSSSSEYLFTWLLIQNRLATIHQIKMFQNLILQPTHIWSSSRILYFCRYFRGEILFWKRMVPLVSPGKHAAWHLVTY